MPELPEVETTKNGITPYLINQKIKYVVVHNKQLRWPVSEEIERLYDINVIGIHRRAKYLLIETTLGILIIHLGMSGSLRLVGMDTPLEKHDHVELFLDTDLILRYNDPRRFGAWLWTKNSTELNQLPQFSSLGPEPLGNEFSGEYLYQKSRKRAVAVKNFLMQNSVVVGVGNIYANEVLFSCGIHPQTLAKDLSVMQCDQLAFEIKRILALAIEQGGTTLKDFLQPNGKPGYFTQTLNVYGRKNEECPSCETPIETIQVGQRSAFFCPSCQQLKKAHRKRVQASRNRRRSTR